MDTEPRTSFETELRHLVTTRVAEAPLNDCRRLADKLSRAARNRWAVGGAVAFDVSVSLETGCYHVVVRGPLSLFPNARFPPGESQRIGLVVDGEAIADPDRFIRVKGRRWRNPTGRVQKVNLVLRLDRDRDGEKTTLGVSCGGVTGFERFCVTEEVVAQTAENGWSACAGSGVWDGLYVVPEEMLRVWQHFGFLPQKEQQQQVSEKKQIVILREDVLVDDATGETTFELHLDAAKLIALIRHAGYEIPDEARFDEAQLNVGRVVLSWPGPSLPACECVHYPSRRQRRTNPECPRHGKDRTGG